MTLKCSHRITAEKADSATPPPTNIPRRRRRRSRTESTSIMESVAPIDSSNNTSSSSCLPLPCFVVDSSRLYKIQFSYEEIGRYYRQSKRRMRWVVASFCEDGSELEHCFELVWSIKSGKTKVIWNGTDVSHIATYHHQHTPTTIGFSWQTSEGVHIQIQARADNKINEDLGTIAVDPPRLSPQYDLLVDGRSFFTLPTEAELKALLPVSMNVSASCACCDNCSTATTPELPKVPVTTMIATSSTTCTGTSAALDADADVAHAPYPARDDVPEMEHYAVMEERTPEYCVGELGVVSEGNHNLGHPRDDQFDSGSDDEDNNEIVINYCGTPSSDIDFRLSMAGLNHNSTGDEGEVVDELRSELYSPMLETLRQRISEFLPQLEDMLSKAIIRAFFVDSDCSQHDTTNSVGGGSSSSLDSGLGDSINSGCKKEPNQVELAFLRVAYDWMRSKNIDQDLRLSFMQKQIDAIFCYVRNDELSPEQAAQILLSVACVLGFEFVKPLPRDTVIFTNLPCVGDGSLPTPASNVDLVEALSKFGTVTAAAVSSDCGFGFGRFQDVSAVSSLLQGCISFHGHVLAVTVLSSSSSSTLNTNDPKNEKKREVTARLLRKKNGGRDAGEKLSPLKNDGHLDSTILPLPPTAIPHLMAPFGIDFSFSSSTVSSISTSCACVSADSSAANASFASTCRTHRHQPPGKPRSISKAMRDTTGSSTASPQSIADW